MTGATRAEGVAEAVLAEGIGNGFLVEERAVSSSRSRLFFFAYFSDQPGVACQLAHTGVGWTIQLYPILRRALIL